MEEHMKKGCTKDEAFKNTQRTAVTSYNETKNRKINQSTKVSAKTGLVHIIFLDKNHPNKQAIQNTVKDIQNKRSPSSVELITLFLVPELNVLKQFKGMPFSENFLAQAYGWAQNRKEHATLTNEDPHKLAEVQTMFINMHKSAVYDENFLDAMQIDGFLTLPMSVESFDLPEDLKTAIQKMIHNFIGIAGEGKEAPESTKNLVKMLQKYDKLLTQFVDIDMITSRAISQIQQHLSENQKTLPKQ